MAESESQHVVLEAFRVASGDSLTDALSNATRRLDVLSAVNQTLSEVVASNTEAVSRNTASQGAKGVVAEAGKAARGLLGSAFGFVSLATSVARLFGGGRPESPAAPPPLTEYAAPRSLRIEAGVDRGEIVPVDFGERGEPRVVQTPAQVTVQVQAMDSRSFLDHSHEIARAVRAAMLEMNAVNDVVVDL